MRRLTVQTLPAAATLTALLTFAPPEGQPHVAVTMLTITNTSSYADRVRVSLALQGQADTLAQYLYYDMLLPGNDTFIVEFATGLPLYAGDVVRGYSETGASAFQVHAREEA